MAKNVLNINRAKPGTVLSQYVENAVELSNLKQCSVSISLEGFASEGGNFLITQGSDLTRTLERVRQKIFA